MDILSIDKTVSNLIDEIKSSTDLKTNDIIRARLAFSLTKVNLGLRMINRIMKLYNQQEMIEDKLIDEKAIETASVRELMVLNSLNTKAMDRYYNRMDKILGSLNLKEIESSLLMLNSEMDKRFENKDELNEVRPLAMDALRSLSQLQANQLSQIDPDDIDDAELSEADILIDDLDRKVDDEEFLMNNHDPRLN